MTKESISFIQENFEQIKADLDSLIPEDSPLHVINIMSPVVSAAGNATKASSSGSIPGFRFSKEDFEAKLSTLKAAQVYSKYCYSVE